MVGIAVLMVIVLALRSLSDQSSPLPHFAVSEILDIFAQNMLYRPGLIYEKKGYWDVPDE
jgi:hypothetical protein